jgi:hypothetical protein
MSQYQKKLVRRGRIFYYEGELRLKIAFPFKAGNSRILFVQVNGCTRPEQ